MKKFEDMNHHPMVDTLVNVLSARTQNPDKSFFTILACYHFTKCASMMRCSVDAQGFGKHLINFYGINAAPSGYGKGHSTKIIEEFVTNGFRHTFMESTLPYIAEKALVDLAVKRAQRNGTDDQEELEKVKAEFRKLGAYLTSFDSGTTPAIKQFRHQLLMSTIGSINLEIDEMGSNLVGNKEVLDVYLELFDGTVKPKLTKNTADSVRNEEIEGKTPTNMLMFGTASMLLDGAAIEKMYIDMLTTGYGRRCFFGYSGIERNAKILSVAERLAMLTDTTTDASLAQISVKLEKLADPVNHNFQVSIPADVMEQIIRYQIYCEELMEHMKSNDEIRRAEARGRYFKTIKLAAAFSFLDSENNMSLANWEAAVKVAEMSAKCFADMLSRDPAHARLAKFLAEAKEPMTYADLMEELTFFPRASTAQKDMIKHAIAWAYKHNIIIKRSFSDDIEFIQGESLEATDLNHIMISYSEDLARDYEPREDVPFAQIGVLTTRPNTHWCSHRFVDGIRRTTHVRKGFNLIVLDVDGTCPIAVAKEVLEDYTYHIYTTKSHKIVNDKNPTGAERYRIVIPTSHVLKLGTEEYSEFMNNILEFLPFDTDEQTTQANRKWESNANAEVIAHEGKLFDVLPFLPKTKKNEERKLEVESIGSMDRLERFFYTKCKDGNRNNTIAKYGFALVDAGYDLDSLRLKIEAFNDKLPKPIPKEELHNTVITSVSKKFFQKG